MKTAFVLVSLLMSVSAARGECVGPLDTIFFQPVSAEIYIHTLFAGMPVQGTTVEITRVNDHHPLRTIISGSDGIAVPAKLPPGDYTATAHTPSGMTGQLNIQVPKSSPSIANTVALILESPHNETRASFCGVLE